MSSRFRLSAGIFITVLLALASCSAPKTVQDEPVTIGPKDHFVEDYSAKLGVQLEAGCNRRLIRSVSDWLGTPYKYGGDTSAGTDCSGFVMNVYKDVFGLTVQRSSNGLYEQSRKIDRKELKEGDLVFFKINTTRVGHVGIYLRDDYFIHATTKRGVMVSSLKEEYYAKYYFAAGRIVTEDKE
jgi:cell wall-associated NlpC family hydrolase